jgi:hypothetical protein
MSDVPPHVQTLRRAMMDADLNSLTFHNMDELFTTRTVARSGPVWAIPRADHALDFSYPYKGATYTPQQFLDRTFTNALLISKNGRVVAEIYCINTNAATCFIGALVRWRHELESEAPRGVSDDRTDHARLHLPPTPF